LKTSVSDVRVPTAGLLNEFAIGVNYGTGGQRTPWNEQETRQEMR